MCRRRREAGEAKLQKPMGHISKHMLIRHSILWAQQDLRQQQGWGVQAERRGITRRQEVEAELEKLAKELGVMIERKKESDAEVPPLSMSSAALDTRYVAAMGRLMADPEHRGTSAISLCAG